MNDKKVIENINEIIQYLEKIKNCKNLNISMKVTPYIAEDHSGTYVKHTKIGSKTSIIIEEGVNENIKYM